MFLSKHKKTGWKLGEHAFNELQVYFMHDNKYESFEPPKLFFRDKYIVGFYISYFNTLIDCVIDNTNLSLEQQNECLIEAFKSLDHSGDLLDCFKIINSPSSQIFVQNPEFQRGINDGVTVIGISYNILKDQSDPIVIKAKDLLSKSSDLDNSLSAAVFLLTICEHIRDNWR